ncbi:MAG: ribose 5-phosphate isomerase B [Candidatus Brocadiia bacterium]|nr:MAG: ribose 5-phosphate isomerase B [Candidatus Brocadiia bacterium]
MKIAIGSDHRGYESKEQIKAIVTQFGHEIIDVGTADNNPSDYPDLAYLAAGAVSRNEADRAILVCGTGIGMSIAANKVKNIRAALCHDELTARISRDHNDANVLCISGDLVGEVLLRKIVEAWLNTEFSGGRHQRRINKIAAIEQGKDPREINISSSAAV